MDLTLDHIYQARENLRGIALPVPLTFSVLLSKMSGARVYLKWENLQKTGSFKIRGAVHKILSTDREELSNGAITASAGNHAQGVAFGARMVGIKAAAVMPVSTPRVKIIQTEQLGATVILSGETYDEAHRHCMGVAARTGMVYIPACEDVTVMAGHGTIGTEILEELSGVDMIVVPVGGGGLISGISVAAKAVDPRIEVIGAQTTHASTMFHCYKAGNIVPVPVRPTLAEGLAGGIEPMAFGIVKRNVDDIVLVDEGVLAGTIRWILDNEHQVVEASGGVGVAAIFQGRLPRIRDKHVVVVVSGGNIDQSFLERTVSNDQNVSGVSGFFDDHLVHERHQRTRWKTR
jgi:threonine dehydratase